MKKLWYSSMLVALTCLVAVAATAAPDAAEPEIAVPESVPAQTPAPALVDAEGPSLGLEWTIEIAASSSAGVVCTFLCNDGIGFLYYCPDPGVGTCCSQAQPACASHGGLDSGICRKGRLGLSCTPL